jgi:hypothetical protein
MRAARLPAESKDPLPLRTATGLDRNSHANVSPFARNKKGPRLNPTALTHFSQPLAYCRLKPDSFFQPSRSASSCTWSALSAVS